jgi:hypothetical protein
MNANGTGNIPGRNGWKLSTISFGVWAIGDTTDELGDEESLAALSAVPVSLAFQRSYSAQQRDAAQSVLNGTLGGKL